MNTDNTEKTEATGGEIGTFKKVLNAVKRFFLNPANVILVVFLLVLAFMIFYPLFTLIVSTFSVSSIQETAYGVMMGQTTGLWWQRLFASDVSTVYFWKPLLNSILMSILASVIAIVYGGIVAFFITRTNMKGKKIISSIFVFPYIMPSWTLATFWQNFWQNPNIGTGRGGMLYNITGLCVPEGFVYGLVPCAVVLGLHYAPFAYILIGGILRNMDANLEEAATMLKASRAKIIYRITLPIVLPALVSTFLLVFASSMSAYAVPQYIGGTMKVLTTYMKSFINSGYYGQGYIMAIVMIVFGVAILLVNQYVTGKRKSFTTVSGKSGQVSYINLSAGKYIVGVVIILISLFCSVLPLITFALESCCVVAGDYSTLTLQYWISSTPTDANNGLVGIFHEKQVWRAFGNSLLLSFLCAIIAGSSGVLIGYAVARKRGTRLARSVDSLAFLPYLMPSMALGAAFLTMAFTFGLGRAFIVLVLVGSVKYLPFASRSGINAMLQLSGEIEEAAVIVGVPWWKRMVRIIFPIQKSTFISGYLLPFTSCMRELSLFVLLSAGSTTLLATLLDNWTLWWPQSANALNLLIIVTVLVINFAVNKLTGASIDKGVGG
ncbi:MAG TPA: iron ABC transporter permease [Candidatus Borkfalkia avicola]|uniref:Iron ABC transporter permease n=1 Tax=Candidatus Borkfalkia avicola TaxID=2838503 RepID=A0A9D2IID1_9FIRM|nr:iron ABC transporter permease [Candidatus Borkfalkia avicola]